MDEAEYARTQLALTRIAVELHALDLPAFIARIERADAMGPVLTPTLYREAAEALHRVRALAEAAIPLREEARRQVAASLARHGGRP